MRPELCELQGWMRGRRPEQTIASLESLNVIDACWISWWSAAGCTWLTVHILPELTQCFINLFDLFFFHGPKMARSVNFTTQSHSEVLHSPHVQTQIPNKPWCEILSCVSHKQCKGGREGPYLESWSSGRSTTIRSDEVKNVNEEVQFTLFKLLQRLQTQFLSAGWITVH